MLERMSDFFEVRLSGYDEHMLNDIESATEFYPYTASTLPSKSGASVLDLGCGTGLELEFYFALNPNAAVTGIDLSSGMLDEARKKLRGFNVDFIQDSYFNVELGLERYDAAVSVESLHHFTFDQKLPLYKNLNRALKRDGYFILTDYFAASDEDEKRFRDEYLALMLEENVKDEELYHFDTPLTIAHETKILLLAGFSKVETLKIWGNTATIKASK